MTTNNGLNINLSGQQGTGAIVGSVAPTITHPTLVGQVNGIAVAAGNIGEIISSFLVVGSGVSMTVNTPIDVTFIDVTAGHWIVFSNVIVSIAGGAALSAVDVWASLTSATLPAEGLYTKIQDSTSEMNSTCVNGPFLNVNVSTTTRVYLSGLASFAGGTAKGSGGIYALRVS